MEIKERKIVIFGAGKIGRSFLGQLFGGAGYQVVFIDVDAALVEKLNERGSYPVIIKGDKEEKIEIGNVSAILAGDSGKVHAAVATAGILSVNVGKNALAKVIPAIARGLLLRYSHYPSAPLDIILAENMREAALFVKSGLQSHLPGNYPLEQLVGLIETSIGKMVPVMPAADLKMDPLLVCAEPYNTLILDRKGFRSAIPEVNGLSPKANIKAWVDRKAFIHNLGHAATAYYGYFLHPGSTYMYEILEDPEVLRFARSVMLQSAAVLIQFYPEDYTFDDLADHIDDLIHRFSNKALKDTVFRVGQDLTRKMGEGDRFMGVIRMAEEKCLPYDQVLQAMSYGFFFRAKDGDGKPNPVDLAFLNELEKDFEGALCRNLLLNREQDSQLISDLKQFYRNNLQ